MVRFLSLSLSIYLSFLLSFFLSAFFSFDISIFLSWLVSTCLNGLVYADRWVMEGRCTWLLLLLKLLTDIISRSLASRAAAAVDLTVLPPTRDSLNQTLERIDSRWLPTDHQMVATLHLQRLPLPLSLSLSLSLSLFSSETAPVNRSKFAGRRAGFPDV